MRGELSESSFNGQTGGGHGVLPPWHRVAPLPGAEDGIDDRVVALYRQGLKTKKIAAQTGLSLPAVGSQLFRARQRGLIGRRNAIKHSKLPSEQLAGDLAKYHRDDAARLRLEQDEADLIRRYNAGENFKAIARAQGVAYPPLSKRIARLRNLGLIPRKQPEAPDLALREADLIARYNAGESWKAIAAAYGDHYHNIAARIKRLRRAGLIAEQQPRPDGAGIIQRRGWKAHESGPVSSPSVNDWPDGPRRMACFCGNFFLSQGKQHRMCDPCRGLTEGPAPGLIETGRVGGGRR